MSESTQNHTSDEGTKSAAGSLSKMLHEAREARGLSAREAADTMKLSAHFLEALESEQFDKLPAPAFVRGYLRSYARLLGLSEDEVIACYHDLAGEDRTDPYFASKREARERSAEIVHEHTGQVLIAVFALAVLVMLIALWAVWPSDEEEESEARGEDAPEVSIGLVTAQTPRATRELPIEAIQAREAVAASTDLGFPLSAPFVPQGSPDIVVTRSGSTIAVDAGGGDHLRFSYSEDCWTEVRDGEDRQIYGDLNRVGQTLELEGQAPFTILVGYAPGVALDFNGQPVVLAPHTRANVATLVLGQ